MSTRDDDDLSVPLLDSESNVNKNHEQLEEVKQQDSRQWVPYVLAAATMFTICNSAFSEVSSLGLEGLLYLSPGSLICGIAFFGYKMISEYRSRGVCWTDLNFMDKETNQVSWRKVAGFLVFTGIYLSYQSLVVLTFGFCLQAGINAGIVSVIWSISPLFGATFDYLIFGQKLTKKHVIGVICLILCAMSISLSGVIFPSTPVQAQAGEAQVQSWVPVILALITPIFFASSGIQTKHLCVNRGFDAFKLSFGAYGIVGFGLFCILTTKFNDADFSASLLTIGTLGSIVNTIGIVLFVKATTLGPLGPVNALGSVSTIMFSIVQAVRLLKAPTILEVAGMLIGILGALVLTIPEYLEKWFRYITCQNKKVYHRMD